MIEDAREQPAPNAPPPPQRVVLDPNDPRTRLVENVREAMRALPFHFESSTTISGLDAGDLFSLSAVLGGTIEIQTVETLNRLRNVWDPDDEWLDWGFARFSQAFPDVRLVNRLDTNADPAMGIELKGWYLLSKERAPSYRYTATPAACADHDLLVVVPWHLSNVLTGTPVVRDPFIEQARYSAMMRNYYWQHKRGLRATKTGIESPENVHPYPPPKTHTSDKPEADAGKNFGRLARSGIMGDYINATLNIPISGIAAKHWISFFKSFTDTVDDETVEASMQRLLQTATECDERRAQEIIAHVRSINGLLNGEPMPNENGD